MTTVITVICVAVALISVFAAYWIGRDSGERAAFEAQQYTVETLTQSNNRLKMDNERLRRERDHYADRANRSGYPPIE